MKPPHQPNRTDHYNHLISLTPHITPESVAEFQNLLLKEHGIELDEAQAREAGSRLLRLYLCKQYWEELKQLGIEDHF